LKDLQLGASVNKIEACLKLTERAKQDNSASAIHTVNIHTVDKTICAGLRLITSRA
jgi:hypothetical protein